MKRFAKKAFTLVELLVVIAIIAILAVAGVVGYMAFTKKAEVNNDTSLVAELNNYVAAASATDKINTPTDIRNILVDDGIDLATLKLSADKQGYVPGFDIVAKKFVLIKDNALADGYTAAKTSDVFAFAKTEAEANALKAAGFSLYLQSGYDIATIAIEGLGLDVGENTGITTINYTGTTGANDVVIRSNGGSLKIIDTNDASHQYHFGSSASVEVTTGNNCYEGHAVVAAMTIKAGKVIASNDSYIGLVEVASGVTLEETTKGVFVIPENADAEKIDATAAASVGYTIEGGTITPSPEKAEKSYYLIEDASSLLAFSNSWNNGDGQFINKIKFADNVVIDINQTPWIPIGTWEHPFHGTIEGMGCTIRGLGANVNYASLYSADKKYYVKGATTGVEGYAFGLIGIAGNGDVEVKDINFTDVSIDIPSGNMVAAVIGFAPSASKFKDSDDNPGFYDDWADSTTIGTHNVTISNINVSGTISAEQDAASIAGKLYNSGKQVIKNCTNSANITANTTNNAGRASGIVSMCSNSSELLIENCTNRGSVTAVKYACGILAYTSNSAGTIKNCVNNGTITATATVKPQAADIWRTDNKTGTNVNIIII